MSIINIGTFSTRSAPKLNLSASAVYTRRGAQLIQSRWFWQMSLAPKKDRVNSVDPGLVLTEGTTAGGLTPGCDFVAGMIERTPLGRVGTLPRT